jgi:hypothetical protein
MTVPVACIQDLRYRDPHIPSGGLTTSLVAVVTDAWSGPGGHSERCVAVGTLDMALGDAAEPAGEGLGRAAGS